MGCVSVLVATRNAASRTQLEESLAEWGYRVTSAADGNCAQALLHTTRFDVCILDWDMPGISGFEICKQLRSGQAETSPLVILSASPAQLEDARSKKEAGANDYITEPFDLRHVRHRMAGLAQIALFRQDIEAAHVSAPTVSSGTACS